MERREERREEREEEGMTKKGQHRRRVMRMKKGKDGDDQQTGREEMKMHMGEGW